MANTPNAQRNKSILESWLRMIKSDTCNKTMLGGEFDVSPRTVGRILQSFGLTGREEDDREIVQELNDGEYDFKTPELETAYFEVFLGSNDEENDDEDDLDDEDFDDEFDEELGTEEYLEDYSAHDTEDEEHVGIETTETEGEFEVESVIDPEMTILDFSIARK